MYKNGTSTAKKTMGLRFWPGSQIVEVFPELFKIQIDRHRPPLLNLSDKYNTFLKYKDNIYNVMHFNDIHSYDSLSLDFLKF